MSLPNHDISEIEKRMRASIDALKREFSGLRTGRASANLLDPVHVMVYGARMPLNQIATVSVPEPRMISVQVWDRSNVQAVDKAIREANLGLNPIMDGQILRLPIPSLTADRRQELVKLAHKYAEQARIAIRQRPARRHGPSEEARERRQDEPGRSSRQFREGSGIDGSAHQGG